MIDSFNRQIRYLRLSVTDRCNLRCRYCMPADGLCMKEHADMLTEEEMLDAVRAAASLGVDKVRITGGEPLIKKNILSLCRGVASIEGIREVCITTNGLLLPKMAEPLREAGVSRLNISLDTLQPDKYAFITRCGRLEDALEGIRCALQAGFERIKINAVLIGGFNTDEIADLAGLTKRYPLHVRFIEMMPMYDSGDFGPEAFVPCSTVTDALPELMYERSEGVAMLYRLPDAPGTVGLIRPISHHFCGSCNRLRLTADGKLKPCLHSNTEFSIKGLSREEMAEQFRRAVLDKPEQHGELSYQSRSSAERNMNQIGG